MADVDDIEVLRAQLAALPPEQQATHAVVKIEILKKLIAVIRNHEQRIRALGG